jgi:ArsR family transcriptional regulator
MTTAVATEPRSSDLRSASQLFHALSDETRLEIVGMLRDGERCVCDLMGALDAAQSRLSFHLKVLKDAGIVTDRRHGRWVYYSLSKKALDEASGFIKSLKGHRRLAVITDDGCCR